MLKNPGYLVGVLNVFPNNKHGNRTDGFGCPELSPMRLGPVVHGQPKLPPAQNVENFHQLAGKCWSEECVPSDVPLPLEDIKCDGAERKAVVGPKVRPGPLYYTNRMAGLLNTVPQRHKYKSSTDAVNKNIPVCFVWVDKQGKEHYLTYRNSRQFYCTFYARLAVKTTSFQQLVGWRAEGKSLRLCGYDGFPLPHGQSFEQAYLDSSVPFGHERVLACMLECPASEWPWVKYKSFEF